MRGLIEKDLCLLLQRSRVLLVMIAIGVLLGFSTDGSFVIGYLTMICAILTVGTISYDEFDNGYPFLMTLPITKKTYVVGKYLFCMLGGLTGWLISIIIYIGCMMIKGNTVSVSVFADVFAFIPIMMLIIAVMLPMQLKFGAEKSRIVLAVAVGGIWVVWYLLMRFLPDNASISAIISGADDLTVMMLIVLICIGALAVSYPISLRIMEKKEY